MKSSIILSLWGSNPLRGHRRSRQRPAFAGKGLSAAEQPNEYPIRVGEWFLQWDTHTFAYTYIMNYNDPIQCFIYGYLFMFIPAINGAATTVRTPWPSYLCSRKRTAAPLNMKMSEDLYLYRFEHVWRSRRSRNVLGSHHGKTLAELRECPEYIGHFRPESKPKNDGDWCVSTYVCIL